MRRRSTRAVICITATMGLTLGAMACGGDDSGSETPTTGAPPTDAPGTQAPTTEGSPTDESAGTTAAIVPTSEGLVGTPAPQPLPERASATIAVSFPVEPFAPLFLAEANGEFEKENVDVEIVTLPSTDATVQVATGRVLMQVGGVTAAGFNAINQGTGLAYMANVHYQSEENQEGLWIRKDLFLPDGSIDESKIPGMKIALGSGGVSSVSTLAVTRWLQEHGYDISDIEPISIGGPDMLIGLEQESVDAGYLITPVWQDPFIAECCTLVTPQPPLAASAYIVNRESISNEPEVLTAVMRALMRTVRTSLQGDYHSDPAVMEQLSEALETPVDVLSAAPSLDFDPDLPLDVDTLDQAQDMWLALGDTLDYTEPLAIDQVADTSIIEELRNE